MAFAAALSEDIGPVLAFLEKEAPTIGKLATGALASVGAAALIKGLAVAKTSGTPNQQANAARVARFALVDLQQNQVVTTLSSRRAYRFLIRPRRRASRTKIIREVEVRREASR